MFSKSTVPINMSAQENSEVHDSDLPTVMKDGMHVGLPNKPVSLELRRSKSDSNLTGMSYIETTDKKQDNPTSLLTEACHINREPETSNNEKIPELTGLLNPVKILENDAQHTRNEGVSIGSLENREHSARSQGEQFEGNGLQHATPSCSTAIQSDAEDSKLMRTYENQIKELTLKIQELQNSRIESLRNFYDDDQLPERQPRSLPNFRSRSSDLLQESKKIKELEAKVQKLNEMNLRWVKHFQKKDAQIKKYKEENEELKAQMRSLTIAGEETQQKHNDACQRIRWEADQTREELETALVEAQEQFVASRQQMEKAITEAEQRASVAIQQKEETLERTSELQRQVEELNRQVDDLTRRLRILGTIRDVLVPRMNELQRDNRCQLSLVLRYRDLCEIVRAGNEARLQEAEATIEELHEELVGARERTLRAEANEALAGQRSEERDELIATQMEYLTLMWRRLKHPTQSIQVRRYEQRYLHVSKEYQKVLHENTQLLAHLSERLRNLNGTCVATALGHIDKSGIRRLRERVDLLSRSLVRVVDADVVNQAGANDDDHGILDRGNRCCVIM